MCIMIYWSQKYRMPSSSPDHLVGRKLRPGKGGGTEPLALELYEQKKVSDEKTIKERKSHTKYW